MEYRKSYLQLWKQSGIDALIMPVLPWVNYPPKLWVTSQQWLGYTAVWNLLDFTALTIPVTKVDAVIDLPKEEWVCHKPRNTSDAFNHQQCEYYPT